MVKKKILILVNNDDNIYNFRKELVLELVKDYDVYVSAFFGNKRKEIEDMGCKVLITRVDRRGLNPFKDLKQINSYKKIINKIKPDLVLTYTIKPNIYGGFICRKKNIPYISNITGLGSGFNRGFILSSFLIILMRMAFKKCNCVYFQNESNMNFLKEKKVIKNYYELIPGSGVNLDEFELTEYANEDNGIIFNFIGRVMKDKGIDEFLYMAKTIKSKYPNVIFNIYGNIEYTNLRYAEIFKDYEKDSIIVYHGCIEREELKERVRNSHCTILPSYFEGISNALLETEALGRPVIASDIPGCIEAIDDGINGFICKVKDAEDLTEKVEKFLSLTFEQRKAMGKAGRIKVEKEFNRNIITRSYLFQIKSILKEEK